MISTFQFARETFDGDCNLSARSESNDFLKVRHGATLSGHLLSRAAAKLV
jgi:hypothetical protein